MQVIETAINRYLALDPELPARLEAFDGSCICIDIIGTGLKLYLLPTGQSLQVRRQYDGEPDATLRGTPLALMKMGAVRNVAPILLQGEVEIIGDMRLGRGFKSLLSDMHIDWEEHLAGLTGDVAAHEIMQAGKRFRDWLQQSGESVAMDVSEYLTEESRDVVTGAEIRHFCQQVDELRGDVDRLEAMVKHLQDKQDG